MKTIKDHLLDATCIAMDKRDLEKHCGNALAELIRLEQQLKEAEAEIAKMREASTALIVAWENKSALSWQPENNYDLLKNLKTALNR